MRAPPRPHATRHRFTRHESRWCRRANHLFAKTTLSRRFFAIVSRLGDGVFWYALMSVMPLLFGTRGLHAALHMAAVGVASLLLYKGLKRWTKRPRPCAADRHLELWVAPLDEFSFPSGHTLHAVAFTLVALAYVPVLAWVLIPFAASVALSRVALGLHYPSDVLAATVIGSALAAFSLWLVPGVTLFG